MSNDRLTKIRDSVATAGRLSDSLLRLGPLRLGLDGVLAWVPGLGDAYSAAVGAFILVQGARARVPLPVLLTAGALMGGRTLVGAVPIAGALAADLFTAHRWSARMIVAAIDRGAARPATPEPTEPIWRGRGKAFAPA